MGERLDLKFLARYPFLKESQEYVGEKVHDLDRFLSSDYGRLMLNRGAERVMASIGFRGVITGDQIGEPERALYSYALARIIVSCIGERDLIERLCRYEAAKATAFFLEEGEEGQTFVSSRLGIDLGSREMPMVRYVELASSMRSGSWRLVNREVCRGRVRLVREELIELMREQIRQIIQRQLPLQVDPELCAQISPVTQEIMRALQEQTLQQFGEVQQSSFPPCMRALIDAITSGRNLPHQGRFALTAFLHTIGLTKTEIVEIYRRAPDFDISRTTYQVDHIAGARGTEYTPPSCATMKTYSLCIGRDEFCGRIGHPLRYYLRKKKGERKRGGRGSGGLPDDRPAGATYHSDVDEQRNRVAETGAHRRREDVQEEDEEKEG